ncbi:MAG: hypothetical protein ACYT04_80845, partial [Nostoc sp.]
QAQLNEKPATNAAQSGDNDWAVTICFYSAIHYVKAYAVISKKTFIPHSALQNVIYQYFKKFYKNKLFN